MSTLDKSMPIPLLFKRAVPHTLPLPEYKTSGAAGFDLQAFVLNMCNHGTYWSVEDGIARLHLYPNEKILIPTGWCVAVPEGYELQIRPRSGFAFKNEVIILNSPGTIDSDYRGEIMVGLKNISENRVDISNGMRIAQAVLAPIVRASLIEVDELSTTERGSGGFGSTGEV